MYSNTELTNIIGLPEQGKERSKQTKLQKCIQRNHNNLLYFIKKLSRRLNKPQVGKTQREITQKHDS